MIDEQELLGSWVHSHEEDDGDVQVFRPADMDLPPSRGRQSLSLQSDRRAELGQPGPDDRGTLDDGTWTLERGPDGAVLSVGTARGRAAYVVVAAEPDRLSLRPYTPT